MAESEEEDRSALIAHFQVSQNVYTLLQSRLKGKLIAMSFFMPLYNNLVSDKEG